MNDLERYNYAFDPHGDAWPARLIRRLPAVGDVLELGPGPGAMTKVLLGQGYRVTVVENDPAAIEVLRQLGVEVLSADLDAPDWSKALEGRQFDAVMACDVLEHLRRPDAVLQQLRGLVKPEGRLVISLPNVGYAGIVAALRQGQFDYSDKGLLDTTHIRFYTRRSIETLLLDTMWSARQWEANRVPLEHSEFAGAWTSLPDAQRAALMTDWVDFDVYQWMVVASPAQDEHAWRYMEAKDEAAQLREKLHALELTHAAEHASLLDHQKAFAEARALIGTMQVEVKVLRDELAQMQADQEAQAVQDAKDRIAAAQLQQAPWWRRWMGARRG